MRLLEVTKTFTANGRTFQKGHRYVMAEDIEGQWRNLFGANLGMSHPMDNVYRPYKGEDLSGKKLMTWRTGGIGDILFLSPVLRYIKQKYPTCHLKVASGCKQSLENMPEVDELYDMPFDAEHLTSADYHLMYQGIIESSSEQAKNTHAVDMFFHYFSIDSTHFEPDVKRPRLYYTQEEKDWTKRIAGEMGIKEDDYVIGVQMESSSPIRNFPKEKLKACVDMFAREKGVKVVMIGSEQHTVLAGWYKSNNPNICVATKFSVRQSMVLAMRYNLIISPDTFMVQVAGALDTPLIGLYGPFPSEVRMKYFKNAVGLDPSVACSPCYKHDFRACIRGFPSPCFTLVNVEDVMQAANYLRHKFFGVHFKYMTNMLAEPDFSDVEKYLMSADRGLCFFPGYFKHNNILRVDPNKYVTADITDLNSQFQREFYPFVLYMNEFQPKHISIFHNAKAMVRPGGFFIAYKRGASEQMLQELTQDIGQSFVVMHSKLNPATMEMLIVGKRNY